jgi:AcrR family transcriptional regulator
MLPRDGTPETRRYDASRRQADARARRDRVAQSARALFLDQGFGATSIVDIARAADVSPQFVYATFESKAGILSYLVDISVAGDHAELALADRQATRDLLAEPDLRKRMQRMARAAREAYERAAPISRLIETSSGADPALAALNDRLDSAMRSDFRDFANSIPTKALRRGVTRGETADIIYAVAAPRTWTALVEQCAWTPERYERWLADALEVLLLA